MKEVKCDDCGTSLGTVEKGYSWNETDDGKRICSDCNTKRWQAKDRAEDKVLEKRQKDENFQDIPFQVFDYCAKDNAEIGTTIQRIKVDDLKNYSTICGGGARKCFVPSVIDYLKKNSGRDFVIAEVYNYSKEIQSLGVHWNGKTNNQRIRQTDKFSDMISEHDGSLRADQCTEQEWDTYESE